MVDSPFVALVRAEYAPRRAAEAAGLDGRLIRASSGSQAAAAAVKSMKRRSHAAIEAIEEVLKRNAAASAGVTSQILVTAYDLVIAGEPASCINAVATIAARFPEGTAALVVTEAAVARAFERCRRKALDDLAKEARQAAGRAADQTRPMPVRLVRRGVGWFVGGGAFTAWQTWPWIASHWHVIAAHFPH
jgi:hypothetical protein